MDIDPKKTGIHRLVQIFKRDPYGTGGRFNPPLGNRRLTAKDVFNVSAARERSFSDELAQATQQEQSPKSNTPPEDIMFRLQHETIGGRWNRPPFTRMPTPEQVLGLPPKKT